MAQPTEYENVTYNAPDGAQMGRTSTDKISFYGATPVVKLSTASTSDVSSVSSISMSTAIVTVWAFANQAELTNTLTAVSSMQAARKSLGIIS